MKNRLITSIIDKGKPLVSVCALVVIFLLTPGCKSLFFPKEEKKLHPTETLSEKDGVLVKSESVMNAGAHIKRISVSKNLSRLIIEKENFSSTDESRDSINYLAELWNIEFNEARTDFFGDKESTVCSVSTNMATFSARGDRLFWIEYLQDANKRPDERVIRGMSQEEDIQGFSSLFDELASPPLYLPWDSANESELLSSDNSPSLDVKEGEETNTELHCTATGSSSGINSPSPSESVNSTDVLSTSKDVPPNNEASQPVASTNEGNFLLTRLLETNPLQTDYSYQRKLAKTLKLKVPNEVKKGIEVWLSPEAQWIVCRLPVDDSSSPTSLLDKTSDNSVCATEAPLSPSQKNDEVSPEWAMVSTQETQRVLRFPEPVPLSLDDLASSPSLDGRVIDVLAVSDAEDLVATLVEAKTKTSPSKSIYAIVIWDLHVGKTVDLQKAKKPLKAIELSQITIEAPIARQKCKFSASGKLFAAMNDSTCISIWQSTNGRRITEIGEHDETIIDFDFFPNEMEIAIASMGSASKIVIWDIRKSAKLREFLENTSPSKLITLLTIPCDQIIFFVNDDGEVKRLNLSSWEG